MDFLKKVLYITAVYFIIVLLWILFSEEKLHLFMLGLQALFFGIIAGGYMILSKDKSKVSETNHFKNDE